MSRKIYDGPSPVIKLDDERCHIALAKHANPDHGPLYFVSADPDGVITLTPIALVPYEDEVVLEP